DADAAGGAGAGGGAVGGANGRRPLAVFRLAGPQAAPPPPHQHFMQPPRHHHHQHHQHHHPPHLHHLEPAQAGQAALPDHQPPPQQQPQLQPQPQQQQQPVRAAWSPYRGGGGGAGAAAGVLAAAEATGAASLPMALTADPAAAFAASCLPPPRPSYCCNVVHGLPGGCGWVDVSLEAVWDQLVPYITVQVSGCSEGSPRHVVSTQPDCFFETNDSADSLPWIELQLP
ncbi:hypothetical protein Agub_g15240, partial [Astrephomene gubernaculifera]